MNDVSLLKEAKCSKNLLCVAANLVDWKSSEIVVLHVFEKVFVEQFKCKALMVSEVKVLSQSNYVMFILRIFCH